MCSLINTKIGFYIVSLLLAIFLESVIYTCHYFGIERVKSLNLELCNLLFESYCVETILFTCDIVINIKVASWI